VEIYNLRKLKELEVRKEIQIKISNRFAALENLNENKDINKAWENSKENIKTSDKDYLDLCELMKNVHGF